MKTYLMIETTTGVRKLVPPSRRPKSVKIARPATLARGAHAGPATDQRTPTRFCAMELVSWLAKEPYSDYPDCASPVVGVVVRRVNDALGTAERQKLVPKLCLVTISAGDYGTERRKSLAAIDWVANAFAPAMGKYRSGMVVPRSRKISSAAEVRSLRDEIGMACPREDEPASLLADACSAWLAGDHEECVASIVYGLGLSRDDSWRGAAAWYESTGNRLLLRLVDAVLDA